MDWFSGAKDEQDRRKTVIAISEAGRAILSEHAAQSAAILVDIERRLGAEKIEAMLDLLEELTDDPEAVAPPEP